MSILPGLAVMNAKSHIIIVNAPDFIIEYEVGFQKNGNHIHTIWREKEMTLEKIFSETTTPWTVKNNP